MGHVSPHPPLLDKSPQLGPEAEALLVSSYPALSRIWALLGTGLALCDPHGPWVPSAGPMFLPLTLHNRVSGLTPMPQGIALPCSLQPRLPLSCHRRPGHHSCLFSIWAPSPPQPPFLDHPCTQHLASHISGRTVGPSETGLGCFWVLMVLNAMLGL